MNELHGGWKVGLERKRNFSFTAFLILAAALAYWPSEGIWGDIQPAGFFRQGIVLMFRTPQVIIITKTDFCFDLQRISLTYQRMNAKS